MGFENERMCVSPDGKLYRYHPECDTLPEGWISIDLSEPLYVNGGKLRHNWWSYPRFCMVKPDPKVKIISLFGHDLTINPEEDFIVKDGNPAIPRMKSSSGLIRKL